MKNHRQSAFSLVELIVVAAVIAVIIGFAVPAANNLIKRLSTSPRARKLSATFSPSPASPRSAANRSVEIRFYRYGDLDTPGESASDNKTWQFHGYQIFEILENGAATPDQQDAASAEDGHHEHRPRQHL